MTIFTVDDDGRDERIEDDVDEGRTQDGKRTTIGRTGDGQRTPTMGRTMDRWAEDDLFNYYLFAYLDDC